MRTKYSLNPSIIKTEGVQIPPNPPKNRYPHPVNQQENITKILYTQHSILDIYREKPFFQINNKEKNEKKISSKTKTFVYEKSHKSLMYW